MTFDNVIYLLRIETTKDEFDESIEKVAQSIPVYAEVKSVGYKEKNSARADGLEPVIKFIMSERLEYNSEKDVEFEGERYRVIDVYIDPKTNAVELTCTQLINTGGDYNGNAEIRYEG